MCTPKRALPLVFLIALLVSACQPVLPSPPAPTGTPFLPTLTPEPTKTAPETVLFIGNSFTSWNLGLNEHLEKMVALSDPTWPVETGTSIIGGADLRAHWQTGLALKEIHKGGWDVVILQGDVVGILEQEVELFYEHSRKFKKEIDDVGAESMIFMPWRILGPDQVDTAGIVAAHRNAADETGAKVAPVGMAWQRAMEERPELNLYDRDNVHPSVLGSYLALNVLYATLFNQSPVGHSYRLVDFFPDPEALDNPVNKKTAQEYRDQYTMSEEEAVFLQRIAWETVLEWQAGP